MVPQRRRPWQWKQSLREDWCRPFLRAEAEEWGDESGAGLQRSGGGWREEEEEVRVTCSAIFKKDGLCSDLFLTIPPDRPDRNRWVYEFSGGSVQTSAALILKTRSQSWWTFITYLGASFINCLIFNFLCDVKIIFQSGALAWFIKMSETGSYAHFCRIVFICLQCKTPWGS